MPFTVRRWNIEEMTGYKPISTFYEDLSIAEKFGAEAVKDTVNRAIKEWGTDYKMLTELVMAINWHSFDCDARGDDGMCAVYCELYYKADKYATTHLKGNELSYYYSTTD